MECNNLTVGTALNKLPPLKKYFIAIATILIIAIIAGQLYQDLHRKQEHLDSKRIYLHHQQSKLVSMSMSRLSLLRDPKNTAVTAAKELTAYAKQILAVHDVLVRTIEQRNLESENKLLAEQELQLIHYTNEFLLLNNEIISSIESGIVNRDSIDKQYQRYQVLYQQYQSETEHFVESLSNYLEKESYENRRVLWLVIISIILLVIVVSVIFYRFISGMVNREFQLLSVDNQLRKDSEKETQEHAKLMLEQQMKMRSILDSTADAIITITADGNIDSFNKSAESMFGYPAEFVIGQNVKILMPEPDSSLHDSYMQNYYKTKEQKVLGRSREVIAKRVDGSEFPIYLSVREVQQLEPKLFTGIIQDITEWKKSDKKLKQAMDELKSKQAQLEDEEQIAKHVFANIISTNNETLEELASWCVPMGIFSGDMILSSSLPSGGLRVVLCDFTGHGLPAALGAVPVSSIFRAMADKGLPLDILMGELNKKLKELLPTGIFCCIAGIDIDAARTHAHIWNAGLPDVIIVSDNGDIKQRVKSDHLPLGVVDYDHKEIHCVDVRLEIGDMIYAYSDGLTEAENEAGDMFGQDRFEQLLNEESNLDGRLVGIRNKISSYMGKAAATDDISLVEIKTLS
ncbi:MAG: SpoIIE family protein phosphatase [Methylophaga sp.]|nr:SpoIIE family protein phosphatase [Methylophaga sp.]